MEHPSECFVLIPITDKYGKIGIVKWAESGYYRTNYEDEKYTQEDIDNMNLHLGVTKAEAHSMVMCSMANLSETEEDWQKHYAKCLNIYQKHEQK